MLKRIPAKVMAVLLAVVMVVGMLPMTVFAANGSVTTYAEFLANFKQLEAYADTYAKTSTYDSGELALNFVRTGVERYMTGLWPTLAGEEITAFVHYVEQQDAANGTTVMDLRDIVVDDFVLPNGDPGDFGHMFGCMNISYIVSSVQTCDLSGWAGDLCDLLMYSAHTAMVPEGTIDEMAAYILEKCFGVNASNAYGWDDFYGDMDGYYFIREYKAGNGSFAQLMEDYYTAELSDVDRAVYFLNTRFPGVTERDEVRAAVYNAYRTNVALKVLEADRDVTNEDVLRQACCYAFADYLFSQAEGLLEGGAGDDGDDSDENLPDNEYYSVFSTTSSVLAPGITQDIKYAMSADGKQMVCYVATVDVSRDDVTIMANYKDNDPSKGWGMQRLEDQVAALVKNHQHIENFTPVVSINGDGFNTHTGQPGGLLVMEGKEWHPVDGDGFFGILEDGSAVIGTKEDYYALKDEIREAIGAFGSGKLLVQDGELVPGQGGARASRTAVGIKADGSVVMMVMDGRQEPFSCGGTLAEIAQVMKDAGCVIAVNMDGGGSTTYMAKPEGSDTIKVVSRPSDGYARSLAASLVAVSTAKSSKEFDRAIIQSDYTYLTIGTQLPMTAVGVNNIGSSAVIPDGTYWKVSDETIGTISADGVFTAIANGEVQVQLMLGDAVVGSLLLHVVVPDTLSFTQKTINLTYGEPCALPIEATYNGILVAINPDDIYFGYLEEVSDEVPGVTFQNLQATVAADYGSRSMTIYAFVLANDDTYCELRASLFRPGESVFEFDQATSGNRQLAWIRDVVNTTTSDKINYMIVDPDEEITLDYTFALDMTTIEIPKRLEEIVYMLPGADVAGTTAFDYLMRLAERVSVRTSVDITVNFSPDLIVDVSGLSVINDFFELKSAVVDENNVLHLKCTWIDRTEAIDENTANPLCILTGIKMTIKDDANWINDELVVANSGTVSYDAYLRASSLYSFALIEENQVKYGLIPFTADDTGWEGGTETGAHYIDTYLDFDEGFIINKAVRQGWYKEGNEYVYYVNHKPATGVHYVPTREDPSVKLFYEFDDNGVVIGKATGAVEYNGDVYYAANGEMTTGWISGYDKDGNAVTYYCDPTTGKAVNGAQKIGGYNYTFTDHILTRGDLVTDSEGTRYRWAGQWIHGQWFQVDGNWYTTIKYKPYVVTGFINVPAQGTPDWKWHLFDDKGVFQINYTGIYVYNGDTYYINKGMRDSTVGLVYDDGYYYYINPGDAKAYKNRTLWVNKTNGLMPAGNYTFDENGRMTNPPAGITPPTPDEPDAPAKNGIVEENGGLYYYINDVMQKGTGLVKLTDDADATYYIYVTTSGRLAVGTYWITQTNNLLDKGKFVFDANGKYYAPVEEPAAPIIPDAPSVSEPKDGVVRDEDGVLRYYKNGVRQAGAGVVQQIDEYGRTYYIYVRSNGQVATGEYWPTVRNDLLERGSYDWGTDGKYYPPEGTPTVPGAPILPMIKNGIYEENGAYYYYVNNRRQVGKGVVRLTDEQGATYYIYVRSNGRLATGIYWPTMRNDLLETGPYDWGTDGRYYPAD